MTQEVPLPDDQTPQKLTYTEYCEIVKQTMNSHPEWRFGQTYFNVLAGVRPDLSEQIRGSKLDPFYRGEHESDEAMTAFHQFLANNW